MKPYLFAIFSVVSCWSTQLMASGMCTLAVVDEKVIEQEAIKQSEDLSTQLRNILAQGESRRVDVELSNALIKAMAPIFEKNGKLLNQRAQTNLEIAKAGLAKDALALLRKAEKDLEKVSSLSGISKSLAQRATAFLPKLNSWRLEKASVAFSYKHQDLLTAREALEKEGQAMVSLEASLRLETAYLTKTVAALLTTREGFQAELWNLNESNQSTEATKENYRETLRVLDVQIKSVSEVTAVTQALSAQLNSSLNWNKQVLESIADLLGRQLNLVTSLASQPLDLKAKAKVVAVPEVATTPTEQKTSLSVSEVLALAAATKTYEAHNQIVVNHFDKMSAHLTTSDAISLAKNTRYNESHDYIIKNFLNLHKTTLPSEDAAKLASATVTIQAHNYVLDHYAKANLTRLKTKDVILLARLTRTYESQHFILKEFVQSQYKSLTVSEILELGKAADTAEATNYILSFAQKK